jgi:hypothetical protein
MTNIYECEKENQKYLDSLNLKSKCCKVELLSNSLDEWFCSACGVEEEK